MKPKIQTDMSNTEYHRTPALNASIIKILHEKTPAHAYEQMTTPGEQTPAMRFGSAAHVIVLQPGLVTDLIAVEPTHINKRTKAGKAEYAEWVESAEGKTIISETELLTLADMGTALHKSDLFQGIIDGAQFEVSMFYPEPTHGFDCKVRIDILNLGKRIIADYKTCQSASEKEFKKACGNYLYDIQARWYVNGVAEVTGKWCDFIFIAQEKKPPYAYRIYQASQQMLDAGSEKIRPILPVWKECIETDNWPGYGDELVSLDLPGWAA